MYMVLIPHHKPMQLLGCGAVGLGVCYHDHTTTPGCYSILTKKIKLYYVVQYVYHNIYFVIYILEYIDVGGRG